MSDRAGPILPRAFHARDALRLARALLGKTLVHVTAEGRTAGRIVEVEAYRGPEDRAAHSAGGRRTPRNEVMWGEPGHAYVYFVYGMHWCANVVAAAPGRPEAVLLRAVEPLEGLPLMRARRAGSAERAGRADRADRVERAARNGPGAAALADAALARGPANLCRAFGIDRTQNGADLTRGAGFDPAAALFIEDAPLVPARAVVRTPRIGVDYAGDHALRPWRLFVAGSAAVSGPRPR